MLGQEVGRGDDDPRADQRPGRVPFGCLVDSRDGGPAEPNLSAGLITAARRSSRVGGSGSAPRGRLSRTPIRPGPDKDPLVVRDGTSGAAPLQAGPGEEGLAAQTRTGQLHTRPLPRPAPGRLHGPGRGPIIGHYPGRRRRNPPTNRSTAAAGPHGLPPNPRAAAVSGRASSDTVSNLICTTRSGWKNLGLSMDSRSGKDTGLFGDG